MATAFELFADHDIPHRHSLDAVLRCGLGRVRLDASFLFVRTHRNDDFVRRKRRKSVANGEIDIGLAGRSVDRLSGQLFGRVVGDLRRMSERFFVVREPVEGTLAYNRHHDLDRFGVPDIRAQSVIRMFDGADDQNVPAHELSVSPRSTPCKRDSLPCQNRPLSA
jgi:hypothetical protein